MNRRSLTVLRDVQLRAILHFDGRAIAKTNNCASVFRGAHLLTSLQLRSGVDGCSLGIGNLEDLSFGRLHRRFEVAVRPEPLHKRNCQKSEADHQRSSNGPTHHRWLHLVAGLPHRCCNLHRTSRACFVHCFATWNTFVRVVHQQQ